MWSRDLVARNGSSVPFSRKHMNGIEKLFYRPNGVNERAEKMHCSKTTLDEWFGDDVEGGSLLKKMVNLLNSPHFHFESNLKLTFLGRQAI